MNKTKVCECCGAKMVEYKHGLSKSLVRSFAIVVKHFAPNRHFSFSDCTDLTYNQASNMQKLRYWGFIEKPENDAVKGGEWVITQHGLDFLMGKIAVPHNAWSYRGAFQRYEGTVETVDEITGGWKYRPEYAKESIAHQEQLS